MSVKEAEKDLKKAKNRVKKIKHKQEIELAIKSGSKPKSKKRHEANEKLRILRKKARWAITSRTAHKKKLEEARAKAKKKKYPDFEPWMLNGCPNTLSPQEKKVAAYVVVKWGLAITATSNGGHATGSYHYYKPTRALDCAGAKTREAYADIRQHFGGDKVWVELFGPGSWYVKNGSRQSGQFPGHTDHIHAARKF